LDSRAVAFLEVMAALAVVAVLGFLVLLIGGRSRQPQPAHCRGGHPDQPPWLQVLAAAVLLLLLGGGFVWRFAADGLADGGWRGEDRALLFLILMLGLAVGGLVVFLIVAFVRSGRQRQAPGGAAQPAPGAATAESYRPPSAGRLAGLLLLALMLLLMAWTWLQAAQQYALMRDLIYPAAVAVALVLLFDKASRAWSVKAAADGFSEWLFCDALVFLLVLAYLNLREAAAPDGYAGFFFDLLGVALFFLVFWLVDRKLTRYRFLAGYAYLIVLPMGLLLWRLVQGAAVPAETGWWETVWPVFGLAIIGFVLEIIALIGIRQPERPVVAAIKDAAFFAAYGALLLVAIPAAA
jgi:hypothetical protein